MTDREKLIQIMENAGSLRQYPGSMASILIENGVTFAKDINVPNRWIPVTERLPEEFASCIVYRKGIFGGHFSMLRYSPALGWHFYDSEWGDVTVDDVTHWMPLPEPPTEE